MADETPAELGPSSPTEYGDECYVRLNNMDERTLTALENGKVHVNEDCPSEAKPYDSCHEIVQIYEQETKQQLINSASESPEPGASDTGRIEQASEADSVETILKTDEVLSNFDTCNMFSLDDGSVENRYSSSDEQSTSDVLSSPCKSDDIARECTVSLPNIDNLLENPVSGTIDASKVENTLDVSRSETEKDEYYADNQEYPDYTNEQEKDYHLLDNSMYSAVDTGSYIENTFQEELNKAAEHFKPGDIVHTSDTVSKSSLKRTSPIDVENSSLPCKKPKKGITFDSVSVYYFPRTQGFTCIPSQGGSTLGMSWNHSHIRKFSLGEHAAEQRRAHRQFCSQQFPSPRNWNEMSAISSDDSDSDEIISDSEMDYENYNFLQPIPTRERRAMLRAAGIHKIDSSEKDECRSIRLSREFCGCTCQMYCDPKRCVCAQAGIKCQVDRMNFPCSCTREGCANENGRIEFNPVRVRTHYIHTLMRLEMEKKKEEDDQRNSLILKNLESNPQLSYSSSTLDIAGNNLMNFSYHHNELQSYYAQSSSAYGAPSNMNSCFNFAYGVPPSNESLHLPSSTTVNAYQGSMSNSNMRLVSSNFSSMDYCCQPSAQSMADCLHVPDYDNGLIKEQENQNFIIRDLTNGGAESGESNVPYASDTFIQLDGSENFGQHIQTTSHQEENLSTTIEVSEETEKEESDNENFGNIIKKTMVESVIA